MLEKNRERQALLEKLTGLRFPAVALRMVREGEALPEEAYRPYGDKGKHIALCQAFAYARRQGRIIFMEKEDHWCWNPIITYGYIDKELGKEGFRAIARAYGRSSASSSWRWTPRPTACSPAASAPWTPAPTPSFPPS